MTPTDKTSGIRSDEIFDVRNTLQYKIGHPVAWGVLTNIFAVWYTRHPYAGFIYGSMSGLGHLPFQAIKRAYPEAFENNHLSQLYHVATVSLSGLASYQAMKHLFRVTERSVFHIQPSTAAASIAGCELVNWMLSYTSKDTKK